jgi:hypothetical protein
LHQVMTLHFFMATVPISYESRLVKIKFDHYKKPLITIFPNLVYAK